jgi:RHS repeat-associated protein
MDDKRRVALIETKTVDAKAPANALPNTATRYQLANHLGSAILEVDEAAAVISYEEYYPYGSTSCQARSGAAETSLKRYRYTGKERDEENGFYYHGARYYAPWIGRWTSCDPAEMTDGPCCYGYVRGRTVNATDPQGRSGVAVVSAQAVSEYGANASGPAAQLARDLKAAHVNKENNLEEGIAGTHNGNGLLLEQVRDVSKATNKKVSEIHSFGHLQSGFDAKPHGESVRRHPGGDTIYVKETAPGYATLLRPFVTDDVKVVFHGCEIGQNAGIEEFVRRLPVGARVYGHRGMAGPGEPYDWVEYKIATDSKGNAIKEKISLGPGKGTIERLKVEKRDLGSEPIIGNLLPKHYVENWVAKSSESDLRTALSKYAGRIPSDVETLMRNRLNQLAAPAKDPTRKPAPNPARQSTPNL